MIDKKIITYLIYQELKYTQLIAGLRNLTFESDTYHLSMLDAIQPLMGVPMLDDDSLPEVSDKLHETYHSFMEKAEDYEIAGFGSDLRQLAEACYQTLVVQIHHEQKQYQSKSPLNDD